MRCGIGELATTATMKSLRSDPIIIVGMGGSGTRLVVRALEECGVFFGGGLAQNSVAELAVLNEANSFVDEFRYKLPLRNDWQSVVSATRPELLNFCRVTLPKKFDDAGYVSGLWGIKDPRNTFTAHVFIEAFPSARILHVIRDPIDVAASKVTQKFSFLPEVMTAEYWLEVWLETDRVASGYKHLLGSRYSLLRYEDVCLGQDAAIAMLSGLADCPRDIARRGVRKHAQPDRIGKKRPSELPRLPDEVSKRRSEYGYPPIRREVIA